MMKEMRITRLAAALGVAVAGAAASGVAMAQGDAMGQVVIFPYYTVQGNMSTFFNVTNTTDSALAVKVRFHEAVNSRDVLDFNILMSPRDAWTGYLVKNANGGTTLMTDDASCTSPIIGSNGLSTAKNAYVGNNADGGPDTAERSNEGYVELMVMGQCDDADPCFSDDAWGNADGNSTEPGIGYLTEHVDGTPRDCATADSYFAPRDVAGVTLADGTTPLSPWDAKSIPSNGNPIAAGSAALSIDPANPGANDARIADPRGYNELTELYPLKANLTLLDISNGIAGGDAALHLGGIAYIAAATLATSMVNADGTVIAIPQGNMVTAQNYPYFLEPTAATVQSGYIWNTTNFDMLEARIASTNVVNEWSSNPDNGVATDWIVTFPTKGFHVDQFCDTIQANNNRWRFIGAIPGTAEEDPPTAGGGGLTGVPLNCATTTSDPTLDLTPDTDYSVALNVDGAVDNDGTRELTLNTVGLPVDPFETRFADGKSEITVQYDLFNREEGGRTASGTAPSPAPPTPLPSLPYEANIVAFTSESDPNVATESANAQTIDASAILSGALYGWADLSFPSATAGVYTGMSGILAADEALPVTGFLLKTRTFGTPDKHYGQIQDHGYVPPQAR